jgi:NADH-quinone oxidoreductase subunit C
MTQPGSGPDSSGSLPDQRRPTPGEAAPGLVQRGSFGAQGSGDTSGFGGLVRRPWTPAPAERPYGEGFDEVADALVAAYPAFDDAVTKVVIDRGEMTLHVLPEHLVELCRTLRDDPALRFELCVSVSAVDYLGTPDRLHSVVQLTSMTFRRRIRTSRRSPTSTRPPTGRSGRAGTCSGSSTTVTPR